MAEKIVQTAGREALGEFAPEFAHFNDDILFGENWNNTDIDLKTRSIITVVALMSQGVTDNSLKYHLMNAKAHGVSQREIAAVVTHTAFYAGWPHAWAVFNLAKEVWSEKSTELTDKDRYQNEIFFPIGEPNPSGDYFVGQSYLAPVSTEQLAIFNVTFDKFAEVVEKNSWNLEQINNYCIGEKKESFKIEKLLFIIFGILSVVLIIVVFIMARIIVRIKKELNYNKKFMEGEGSIKFISSGRTS